jgi:putative ABC transport system substrate-binding protein
MRKLWLLLMALAFHATAAAAEPSAQSRIIGFFGEDSLSSANIGALKKALGELGYDGQAVTIETRFAGGRIERLDDVAHELVQREVELIVALGLPAGEAAKRQTRTIPIVIVSRTEAIKAIGNVTGASNITPELGAARLELLKEISPRLSRVAVLWHEVNPMAPSYLKKVKQTAQSLGLEIYPHKLRSSGQFQTVFEAVTAGGDNGMIVEPQLLFTARLPEIAGLCLKARLAAVSGVREFAEAGGLISYGLSVAEMWNHAAFLIDKIFTRPKPKAGKPIELPAAQPTKFELAINLNTAGKLGIAVPPALLARAARVVR